MNNIFSSTIIGALLLISFAVVYLGTESFAQDNMSASNMSASNMSASNMTSQNQTSGNQTGGPLEQIMEFFSGGNQSQ